MNFLEKLDFLMDRYGLNKRTLSQKSEIPYTTIDNWYKRGYEGLKLTTLRKLNEYFNTTLDFWIMDEITDPNYGKSSGFKVEYEEMEIVKKYRSLDPYGQETVNIVLDREISRVNSLKEKDMLISSLNEQLSTNDGKVRYIQYYQRLASAGSGQIVFENLPTEQIAIPDTPKYKKVSYAIGVNGRSMEPMYYDNEILLVEMTNSIEIGEIGIFMVNGDSYVKKLGVNELISANKDFDNIPCPNGCRCIGRVIDRYLSEADKSALAIGKMAMNLHTEKANELIG